MYDVVLKVFEDIKTYITRSQEERQRHLCLEEDCIEIGGVNSGEYRALLAHFLHTTIPTRLKPRIVLCHACHNHWCSNPRHMYWGTDGENLRDAMQNGRSTFWESTVKKYGLNEARQMRSRMSSKAGKHSNRPNRLKCDEIKRRRQIIMSCDCTRWGWVNRASKRLGISHASFRRFVDKHMSDVRFFRRLSPNS